LHVVWVSFACCMGLFCMLYSAHERSREPSGNISPPVVASSFLLIYHLQYGWYTYSYRRYICVHSYALTRASRERIICTYVHMYIYRLKIDNLPISIQIYYNFGVWLTSTQESPVHMYIYELKIDYVTYFYIPHEKLHGIRRVSNPSTSIDPGSLKIGFLVLIQNAGFVRDNGKYQTKEGHTGRKPVSKKLLGRHISQLWCPTHKHSRDPCTICIYVYILVVSLYVPIFSSTSMPSGPAKPAVLIASKYSVYLFSKYFCSLLALLYVPIFSSTSLPSGPAKPAALAASTLFDSLWITVL